MYTDLHCSLLFKTIKPVETDSDGLAPIASGGGLLGLADGYF
jgi:hypothetical protein